MLLFSIISNSYIVQFVHIDVICSFYLLHITLFIVAIYCNLFSHSIVDGHLNCFQFGTVLHTTVNILHIYICHHIHTSFCMVYTWSGYVYYKVE